ncbi:MAG: oxygen-independent coproporphyrinogen III oxidase [Pseudomonadales bacterium]|nr:oxygen-independent coproporphyrinogen III oxidase [Pseudomonadales bacterium]
MSSAKVIWLDKEHEMALALGKGQETAAWDKAFIEKHDVAGPRYTSYPTALQFHEEFSQEDYRLGVQHSNQSKKPLSVYVHLPFCESLCYYCACNKIVTKSSQSMRHYLDNLILEIEKRAVDFTDGRPVYQMHWGGGTPTYYDGPELTELMYHLGRQFHMVDSNRGEFSIEVDPRSVDTDKLSLLKGLGFNRISLGIQDFDEDVQKAINRVQPLGQIQELVSDIRALQYGSLNFDLIYGLPAQTPRSVMKTVEQVIDLSPDRISLFNYAHLPSRFKAQALMDEAALPSSQEKLEILCESSQRLIEAGYVYIGMDHFAKPDDELAVALRREVLHRNFQGYTTYKDADLVGVGVSSISQIADTYSQNTRSIKEYQALLDDKQLPTKYGVTLTEEDKLRRDIIMSLICGNHLEIAPLEETYKIDFKEKFSKELELMGALTRDGIVEENQTGFHVTEKGRLVVRRVCMVFDEYLPDHLKNGQRFSRII